MDERWKGESPSRCGEVEIRNHAQKMLESQRIAQQRSDSSIVGIVLDHWIRSRWKKLISRSSWWVEVQVSILMFCYDLSYRNHVIPHLLPSVHNQHRQMKLVNIQPKDITFNHLHSNNVNRFFFTSFSIVDYLASLTFLPVYITPYLVVQPPSLARILP